MLHEFLSTHRAAILARTRAKVAARPAPRATAAELEDGIPLFLDQLIEILRSSSDASGPIAESAGRHGAILLKGGFTVAQVVPTQWALVLGRPELGTADLSRLRIAGTGASRVPAELVAALRGALGVPVVVRYTSTEASLGTGTVPGDPDEAVVDPSSAGGAVAGLEPDFDAAIASGDITSAVTVLLELESEISGRLT